MSFANQDGTLSRYEVGESALTSSEIVMAVLSCYGPQSNAHGNYTTAWLAQNPEKYQLHLAITPMPVDYGNCLGSNANAMGVAIAIGLIPLLGNLLQLETASQWE